MRVAMVTYNFANNGIGAVILNYSRDLIDGGNEVVVLAGGIVEEDKKRESIALGINVIQLPDRKRWPLAYLGGLYRELRARRFDVVHVHGNSGMVLPDLLVARVCRVVAVVCHCHNTECKHPVLHKLLKGAVPYVSDVRLACSREAGTWLFGKASFTVLPNVFDTARFAYSPEERVRQRSGLGISKDAFVLGNVARLNPEKNHAFLIQVFEEVVNMRPDAFLVIAGDGPGRAVVESLVTASSAKDKIVLLGNVPDPSGLYSAFDAFVFPSHYEGFGIVLLEAQISGLHCWASDSIPSTAGVCDLFHQLPLSENPAVWAACILSMERDVSREEASREALDQSAAFDIRNARGVLPRLYEDAMRRRS